MLKASIRHKKRMKERERQKERTERKRERGEREKGEKERKGRKKQGQLSGLLCPTEVPDMDTTWSQLERPGAKPLAAEVGLHNPMCS